MEPAGGFPVRGERTLFLSPQEGVVRSGFSAHRTTATQGATKEYKRSGISPPRADESLVASRTKR